LSVRHGISRTDRHAPDRAGPGKTSAPERVWLPKQALRYFTPALASPSSAGETQAAEILNVPLRTLAHEIKLYGIGRKARG
jgi:hypothetical protein